MHHGDGFLADVFQNAESVSSGVSSVLREMRCFVYSLLLLILLTDQLGVVVGSTETNKEQSLHWRNQLVSKAAHPERGEKRQS